MKESTQDTESQVQPTNTPALADLVALVHAKKRSAASVVREYGIPRWKIYYEVRKLRERKNPIANSLSLPNTLEVLRNAGSSPLKSAYTTRRIVPTPSPGMIS